MLAALFCSHPPTIVGREALVLFVSGRSFFRVVELGRRLIAAAGGFRVLGDDEWPASS